MNFSIIIIGIVIGGMLTLLSLVFGIISLANGKTNNAIGWISGFVVALAIVIFSVVQLMHRLADKVKTGIEWVQENGNNTYNDGDEEAGNSPEMRKTARQEWLDSLQMHNLARYEDKVPVDFYINKEVEKDSAGIVSVPFLYPFRINYNPVSYTGNIVMEGLDSILVQNVNQIAFDQNFAIIKVDNTQSPELLRAGHAEVEYLLFDLRTRNYETAPNNEKLLDLANRIGYTGPATMQYLSDALRGWAEDVTYD